MQAFNYPIDEVVQYDGTPSDDVLALPHYNKYCPKTLKKNLAYRAKLRIKSLRNARLQNDLYQMCEEDILFWINSFCIGAGTRVVTQRGPVPIEQVTPEDLVWDGDAWISQEGALYRGRRHAIFAYKIFLTPDHEVWTQNGWQVASKGYDRAPVRLPDGYQKVWELQENQAGVYHGSQIHKVYDLLNCGPKKAFTVLDACDRPLLVHNCCVFEPRPKPKILPFITWPHQDNCIALLSRYLGKRDIGIEKSRGEGASWMFLMVFLHQWIFDPNGPAFGLVSRNELAVDNPIDPDSLMWKLDFQLKHLPGWMVNFYNSDVDRSLTDHVIRNRETGATIVGYSATGDVASGGRKTAFAMDELAKFSPGKDQDALNSTQHVTECRILVSTPKGDNNAYYSVMHTPSSMLKIILDWKDNQNRRKGLYTSEKGVLKLLDQNYRHSPDYPFILDGKVRSPWYDSQCRRPGATPQSIAQELDRDYGGSTYKFFGVVIDNAEKDIREPSGRFDIDYSEEELLASLVRVPNGPLKLWCKCEDGCLPIGDYVLGVDISAGVSGEWTSNSAICILEKSGIQMIQVGEWASPSVYPQDLALLVVSLCQTIERRFGSSCFLIWDSHGPTGAQFANAIMERTTYRNFYRRNPKKEMQQLRNVSGKRKSTKPGYWNSDPSQCLGRLRDAIHHRRLVVRSKMALQECSEWEMRAGKLVHVPSMISDDETGKGRLHADRAMALAMAWHACLERPHSKPEEVVQKVPYGSLAWRMQVWEQEDRTSADLYETVFS